MAEVECVCGEILTGTKDEVWEQFRYHNDVLHRPTASQWANAAHLIQVAREKRKKQENEG